MATVQDSARASRTTETPPAPGGRLPRNHWQRAVAELDPVDDAAEIYGILATHEFPWDTMQALSFALFRTYAVPSIGQLLDQTRQFADHTQQRYDDTVLLLDAVGEHGVDAPVGRAALRRINQMHRMYDISNDDMRYVLATFVVVPVRWIAAYGYRALTASEIVATTEYYRGLGKHMNITGIPADYAAFTALMDAYEREHFAPNAPSTRVADSTLALMTTFYPAALAAPVRAFSRALMDDHLLVTLGYQKPGRTVRTLSERALTARAAVVARMPARRTPARARDDRTIRSYPGGYDVADLGTFPARCPVPR